LNNCKTLIATSLLTCLIAACGGISQGGSVFRYFSIERDGIHVHSHVGADAIVSAAGDLSIDGASVPVTPEQRGVVRYYDSISHLRDDALEPGKAGARTGTQALASVASGLASGNPDKIGPEIEAKAANVESAVAKLCTELAQVRAFQNEIARQLPQFLPYAQIDEEAVASCRKDARVT
jgi:hypothetical protein